MVSVQAAHSEDSQTLRRSNGTYGTSLLEKVSALVYQRKTQKKVALVFTEGKAYCNHVVILYYHLLVLSSDGICVTF